MDKTEVAAQIDAANNGEATSAPVQEGSQQQGQPAQEQTPAFDPAEFKAFMDGQKQWQNQLNSRLGSFSARQSEMDKYLAAQRQTQNQAPKSWADLDPQTQKATRELIRHIVDEEYKDKWGTYDKVAEGFQTQERNNRILGIANGALGQDFGKYDQALGSLYTQVKQAAQSGDEGAERFLKEIHDTDSGVYRLIEMAKANISQSLQAQSDKAKLEQEGKAKRAASGVGGGAVRSSASGSDGLPTDKAERRKAIASLIDESNSAR